MFEWIKNVIECVHEWFKWHSDVLTFFAAAIGGGFALYQWIKQRKIRRAEFVYQLMQDLRFVRDGANDDILDIRYKIEYRKLDYIERNNGKNGKSDKNKFVFRNNDGIEVDENEMNVDKYLSLLNYICYLRKTKAIGRNDFNIFRYTIVWTLKACAIKKYLLFLCSWSDCNGVPCSFQYLVDYGMKNICSFKKFMKG